MKTYLALSTKLVSGKTEILIRLSAGRGKDYRVKSHIFIEPSRFKDGKIVIPRINSHEQKEVQNIKNQLDALIQYLTDKILDPEFSADSSADIQELVNDYFHPQDKTRFFVMWDKWVSQAKVSDLRKRRYAVMRGALERYEQHTIKQLPLTLTADDVQHIESFLRTEHTWDKSKAERGDNTIRSLMNVLSTFINWLIKQGTISSTPFIKYIKPKEIYGTPYFLTIEERNKIADTDFGSDHLNQQRDVFIFQCLTGCRVGDLLALTKDNIVGVMLQYTPNKTMNKSAHTVSVPLNERAMEIISRYNLSNKKLLPFISSQKYNDAIKVLCMRAGIDRSVTIINPITKKEERKPIYEVASSHMARRTFIGNLYNQVQDPNIIGSMSGHSEGSRAFSRYRTIGDEVKKKVIELIK